MTENIHYVNKTGADLEKFFPVLAEAYKTGIIAEDYEDIFTIEILEAYNADGSNRMLIDWV